MKKQILKICGVLLTCISLPLQARSTEAIPDSVYNGLPFPMEKVVQPQFPDYKVCITDFGATPDGKTLNTQAINNAIATVSQKGGGTVVIPAGFWITGPIKLQSGVNLYTERNAFVLFTEDHSHYKKPNAPKHALSLSPIYADNARNIAITGHGVFDGNGNTWRMVKRSKLTAGQWKQRVASGGVVNEKEDVWYPSQAAKEGEGRPNMVRLYECKNVLLQGITFRNSPAWCIHPIHCEELTIHQVTVINPWYSQNGDALDVESCNRVVIYDCVFDAGDDAICIKSGKDKEGRMRGWPCQNVIARNNVVYHGHGGFVVGSEMSGGVKNVYVTDCTFLGTDVGLRFKSTRGRGGVVEGIYIHNINMIDIPHEALLFDLFYGGKGAGEETEDDLEGRMKSSVPPVTEKTPAFRDIHITNVTCRSVGRAMFFNGLPEMPIRNVHVKDVVITDAKQGIVISQAENVSIENVKIDTKGTALQVKQAKDLKVNGKTYNNSATKALNIDL